MPATVRRMLRRHETVNSEEETMADLATLARRIVEEVIGQGKVELIDDLLADDFVEHEAPPGVPEGKDSLRGFVEMFRGAFPDLKAKVVATAVDGDEVWVQSNVTGTHKGEFNGIPPTGKTVSIALFDRIRTRDGKAIEHWGLSDNLTMMIQLGVVPESG
jgi:steroid delta-isomerase-like uncharacterized protein